MSIEEDRRFAFYINKIEDLPSLPVVVLELTRLIDNPMSSTSEIEDLLGKDQGLTLKVLKLANSAYYAIPGGAKTLLRAITYLGFNSVKQIVLTSTLFKMLDTKAGQHFNVSDFWKHSAGTGAIAELLARKMRAPSPEDAFVCGLVHDMGKIILHMVDQPEFDKVCALSQSHNISHEDAERDLNSPKHTHWGLVLAKKWRLPMVIQSAVKDHHTERWGLRLSTAKDINTIVDAVYLANKLVHNYGFGSGGRHPKFEMDPPVLERNGISQKIIDEMDASIRQSLTGVESLLEALNAQ